MIAKNEEKWIGECLEHLKPIAAEMIMIDTGSTDRTIEIARAAGARVSTMKWEGDFAKARNLSLEKATQRWILIIDPDERYSFRDLEKLKALVQSTEAMAFSFNARNYCENTAASGFKPCTGEYPLEEKTYPGFFESRKVRLFQNIPSVRFVGSVHELVESTIKGPIVDSEIPVHHYGSSTAVNAEKQKKSFYQQQGIKKIKEQPNDWKAYFELGVEYLGAGEFQKAVRELEKARNLRPRDALVLSNLGYALMEANQLPKALEVLSECLTYDANHHDAMLNRGVVTMRQQKYPEAIKVFDQIVKKYPQSFLSYRNAGLCFAHQKKFHAAAKCFEQALKIFPQYTEAKVDLGITCYAAGRRDLAKPILEDALRADPRALRAKAVLDELKQNRGQR